MTIPRTPPADIPTLIEQDRAELLDLLAGLTDEQWRRPSPCPGWSVLDLAVHLVGVDLGVLRRAPDAVPRSGSGDAVASPAERAARLDDHNRRWVEGNRRLTPRAVIDMLRWTGRRLVATYRAQDPAAVAAFVRWASDAPVPTWFDQARELTERWVHRQQIHRGVGRPSRIDPEMTGIVLDTLSWAYPHRLSRLARSDGTAVAIEVTGAVERRWRFEARNSVWVRAAAVEARPAVRLALDADLAWRLLTNGLDEPPSLEVAADAELAAAVLSTRGIIGVPNF